MRKFAFILAMLMLSVTLCACQGNGIDVPEDISPFVSEDIEKYEQWKKEANIFKKDIKKGKKTEE